MPNIHVVTDSGARFSNTRMLQQYPVTIVPYQLDIAGQRHKEDVDLRTDESIKLLRSQSTPPRLIAPSVNEYVAIYSNLSRVYDAIISVHTSREISDSWENARKAALQVKESAQVAVVDSQSICGGQGMLVRLAAEAAINNMDFEPAVKMVRGAVERIYSVYYVESMDYLLKNEIMSPARTILGTKLGIKPILSIEEGRLMVTEKVKSRSQAIDRLVEFISEFDDIDDAMILQNRTNMTDQARTLQDRLSQEFPGRHFPYVMYGASLATLIGTEATGVVVLEKDLEGFEGFNDDEEEEDQDYYG